MDAAQAEILFDFTYKGAQSGLTAYDVQLTIAVELAIQSGELALPWSQEEVEAGLPTGPVPMSHTRELMRSQPHFNEIAKAWAYVKFPQFLYMLWV